MTIASFAMNVTPISGRYKIRLASQSLSCFEAAAPCGTTTAGPATILTAELLGATKPWAVSCTRCDA